MPVRLIPALLFTINKSVFNLKPFCLFVPPSTTLNLPEKRSCSLITCLHLQYNTPVLCVHTFSPPPHTHTLPLSLSLPPSLFLSAPLPSLSLSLCSFRQVKTSSLLYKAREIKTKKDKSKYPKRFTTFRLMITPSRDIYHTVISHDISLLQIYMLIQNHKVKLHLINTQKNGENPHHLNLFGSQYYQYKSTGLRVWN